MAPVALRVVLAAAAALALTVALVVAWQAGETWLGLVAMASAAAVLVFCSADPKTVLLQLALATLTLDVSVALFSGKPPGMYLFVSDLFAAGYACLWLAEKAMRREALHFPRLAGLAFAYLGFLWLSVAYSHYPMHGIFLAIAYTKYILLFAVLADDLRTARQFRAVLHALAVALAANCVLAFVQLVTQSPLGMQGTKGSTIGVDLVFDSGMSAFRPSGLTGHPNTLAGFLTMVLPPLMVFVLLGRRAVGARFWPALALLAAGIAALVTTLSRGGWIALGVAALFIVAMLLRERLMRPGRAVALAVLCAIGALLGAAVYPEAVQRLLSSDDGSTQARLLMIDQALLIVRQNPLLGVGLGGYVEAARDATPSSFSHVSPEFQEGVRKQVAHNKYLLTAAENGLAGLALFCLLMWHIVRQFFRVREWRDPGAYAFALGLTAAVLGQLVFFLFDHFYADVRVQILWVYAALLLALARQQSVAAGRA